MGSKSNLKEESRRCLSFVSSIGIRKLQWGIMFWFCCLYFVSKIYFVCWCISLGIVFFFLFLKIFALLFIHLFTFIYLATSGLSCSFRDLLLWHVGSGAWRLSCHMVCAILVPRPGIEPEFPALEGRFLTIGPPETFQGSVFHLTVSG